MKLEYIGCCFRVEFEVFSWTPKYQRFRVAARSAMPELRRKMLALTLRQLKRRTTLGAASSDLDPYLGR